MIQNKCNTQEHFYNINLEEKARARVIRKFVNPAIYIEEEILEMPPQRKISPITECPVIKDSFISRRCSYTSIISNNTEKSAPIVNTKNGIYLPLKSPEKTPKSAYFVTEKFSSSSNESLENSDNTIKPVKFENFKSELRLSLARLETDRSSTSNSEKLCCNKVQNWVQESRQDLVQHWLEKKETERKLRASKEAELAKQREAEKQKLLEQERETFKKWLAKKKKEEETKRLQKTLEMEKEKLKEAEREKKKVESNIHFNLWLGRKKKDDLDKKLKENLVLLTLYEDRLKRMEDNEKAYKEWLEKSKYKQKPVPMNRGLESLCSSASVAYINPIPWKPNIENPNFKSASR